LRVVLLLDDPPTDDPEIVDRLARTRAIIDEIRLELSGPLELAREAFDRTETDSVADARSAVAAAYHMAAWWLRSRADV
ncbi:hypothetical protein ACO1KW_14905, partial [Staphylococcus aureus]